MEGKVHIRVDEIELDCEGSEEFLRKELPNILDAVVKLRQSVSTPGDANPHNPTKARVKVLGAATTRTIATKIGGVASGGALLMAAAAKLSLVDKKEPFSREELHTEMKTATGFYKKTYSKNLGSYLKTLVKSKLHEVSADSYALPDTVKSELEEKLLG